MKVHLFAPFRALVNLESDSLNRNQAEAKNVLTDAAQNFSRSAGVKAEVLIPDVPTDFKKYRSLSEDSLTPSTCPLYGIALDGKRKEVIASYLVDALNVHGFGGARVKDLISLLDAQIFVFDNTISVGRFSFDLGTEVLQHFSAGDQVDRLTVTFCDSVTTYFNSELFPTLIREMLHSASKRKLWAQDEALVIEPSAYSVFDDLSEFSIDGWEKGLSPLIWSQRTLEFGAQEAAHMERILSLARVTRNEMEPVRGKDSWYLIRGGTCLFFNEHNLDGYFRAVLPMQYYAALLNLLNDSYRRIHTQLSLPLSAAEFDAVVKRIAKTGALLDYAVGEFSELLTSGFQAERLEYATALASSYKIGDEAATLRQRQHSLSQRSEQLVATRNMKLQRGVEAILLGITGIAVADLALNMGSLAKSNPGFADDGYPGPLDIMSRLSLDPTLGIILISLAGLSLLHYKRRL